MFLWKSARLSSPAICDKSKESTPEGRGFKNLIKFLDFINAKDP